MSVSVDRALCLAAERLGFKDLKAEQREVIKVPGSDLPGRANVAGSELPRTANVAGSEG